MKDLANRVAVVTGAANGIGRGIVEVLASEGAAVALLDLDLDAAEQLAEALRNSGSEAMVAQADVVDRAAMDEAAAAVLARFGRIDILAANAGIYPARSLDEMEDADWDRVMDVNVK